MTGQEWKRSSRICTRAWPHAELTDETVEAWYVAVQDLDQQDALTAVEAMLREGREFPPNGGQIRQKTIELAAPPADWSRGYTLAMNNPVSYAQRRRSAGLASRARPRRRRDRPSLRGGHLGDGLGYARGHRAQFRQIYELAAAAVRDGLAYAGLPEVDGRSRAGWGRPCVR